MAVAHFAGSIALLFLAILGLAPRLYAAARSAGSNLWLSPVLHSGFGVFLQEISDIDRESLELLI